MLADTGSERANGGGRLNPILEPVIKVRPWIHDSLVGFAGNINLSNQFLANSTVTRDFEQLVQDAREFQNHNGREAPDFLIAKRDGSKLYQIRNGLVGERQEAWIGSQVAYQRLMEHRTDQALQIQSAGISIRMMFFPPDCPTEIQSCVTHFCRTVADSVDNVCGVPICLVGCREFAQYLPLIEASSGREYEPVEHGGWSVANNDAWNGGHHITVIPLGGFGVAFYLPFNRASFYWNIQLPSHDGSDSDQTISGVVSRDKSFDEFCQWLADAHWTDVHAWAPGSEGRIGAEGRLFRPITKICPELADAYDSSSNLSTGTIIS